MNYLEYIRENADRITHERQASFTIEEIYRGNMTKLRQIQNEAYRQQLEELASTPLSREFVRDSFNASYYKGYIATMLWGGLGLNSWSQVVIAMMMDKKEVESKISSLQKLLDEEKIRDAFMSLQDTRGHELANQNKFSGVDISYFTKLLFFMYQGKSVVPPLIFDKWGTYIHAGILISLGEFGKLNDFYKMGYDSFNKFYIGIKFNRTTDYRYAVYDDYLKRMATLSKELNLSDPGLLEEFLFGRDLKARANKNDNNPRFFVRKYVQNYYDTTQKA